MPMREWTQFVPSLWEREGVNGTEGVTYSDIHSLRVQFLVCALIVAWMQLELISTLVILLSRSCVSAWQDGLLINLGCLCRRNTLKKVWNPCYVTRENRKKGCGNTRNALLNLATSVVFTWSLELSKVHWIMHSEVFCIIQQDFKWYGCEEKEYPWLIYIYYRHCNWLRDPH